MKSEGCKERKNKERCKKMCDEGTVKRREKKRREEEKRREEKGRLLLLKKDEGL